MGGGEGGRAREDSEKGVSGRERERKGEREREREREHPLSPDRLV